MYPHGVVHYVNGMVMLALYRYGVVTTAIALRTIGLSE